MATNQSPTALRKSRDSIVPISLLMEMVDYNIPYKTVIKSYGKNIDDAREWWKELERLDMKYNQGVHTQPQPTS